MDKLKQWVALTVVGVLAVMAAGWFLLVSPKRSDASTLNTEAQSQDQANAGLRTQLDMLKAQAKDEPKQEAKLAAVAAKIPDNPALPALIRALDKASADTGVDLSTLSPSVPSLVAPPAATTPVVASGAQATAPRSSAAGAAAAGNLAAITVALNVSGTYFQVLEFVDRLEQLSRAFKVTGLSLSPSSGTSTTAASSTGKVTVGVAGTVYMAAGRQPVTAVNIPKSGK